MVELGAGDIAPVVQVILTGFSAPKLITAVALAWSGNLTQAIGRAYQCQTIDSTNLGWID